MLSGFRTQTIACAAVAPLPIPPAASGVLVRELVTADAVGRLRALAHPALAPDDVLAVRDGLQVPWVHAEPVPTQVVHEQAGRDWADVELVCDAMGVDDLARDVVPLDLAVALTALGTSPRPASIVGPLDLLVPARQQGPWTEVWASGRHDAIVQQDDVR